MGPLSASRWGLPSHGGKTRLNDAVDAPNVVDVVVWCGMDGLLCYWPVVASRGLGSVEQRIDMCIGAPSAVRDGWAIVLLACCG